MSENNRENDAELLESKQAASFFSITENVDRFL